MTSRKYAMALSTAALLLGQTLPVTAACVQGDFQGARWKFQMVQETTHISCIVAVNAAGAVTQASTCTYEDTSDTDAGARRMSPPSAVPINVGIGAMSNLTLDAPGACLFKGQIVLTAGMDSLTITLLEAALSMDRQKATGIGGNGNMPLFFTLTKIMN